MTREGTNLEDGEKKVHKEKKSSTREVRDKGKKAGLR